MKPNIGILALQGDFKEHRDMLEGMANSVYVRNKEDFKNIDGLIIPGGESTTMMKLINRYNLAENIRELYDKDIPIFGTCAGAIILADNVVGNNPKTLDLIEMKIERNAYGRQLYSFEDDVLIKGGLGIGDFPAVFIRAPKIISTGHGVYELAHYKNDPVMVFQNNVLATTFHPELSGDPAIHAYFLSLT
ncbi:MAG: pyridoxal 5'-phosphate synthase glutaminase subunit PdxT, partial [archaeon]